MNKVILVGRLGKDPETTNGVVKFSLATDESYKDKNGQKVDKTAWHNCVAFGKIGEVIAQYVAKGHQFCVEGKIDYHKHEEKYYTSIIVNGFTFIGNQNTPASNPVQDGPFETTTDLNEQSGDLPWG